MPIYEYFCEDCQEDVEVLVLSSRDAPECPKCCGGRLRRILSVFSSPGDTGTGAGDSCAGPGTGGFS